LVPPVELVPVAVTVLTPYTAVSNGLLFTERVGSVAPKVRVRSPVVPLAVAEMVVPRKVTGTVEPGVNAQVLVSEAVAGLLDVEAAVTSMVVLDEQLVDTALVGGVVEAVVDDVAAPAAPGRANDKPDTPSTMIAPALPNLFRTNASSLVS
jgi:hypothetical protein